MGNFNEQELFEHLLSLWQPHKALTAPPPTSISLWSQEGCCISIGDEWGPPIPYHPIDHRDGHQNHGYVSLKDYPEATDQIPEAVGWPELQQFLKIINAPESPIESAGCEKGFFSSDAGVATTYLGSYVDVVYSEALLNDYAENLLFLASKLVYPIEECAKWWSMVNISLCRFKHIAGTQLPWGLQLHVTNHGRTEEEARKCWGVTLLRLGSAVAQLPKDLKWIE